MKMRSIVLGAGMMLSGCATVREAPRAVATLESIDYETSPCFGACPTYRLSISADGNGVFTGVRNTAVAGERAFRATPAQFAAFAAVLRPYRPKGERSYAPGKPGCEQVATDQPSIEIRWTDTDAKASLLGYYLGCNMEANRDMANALLAAPEKLPVTKFIDKR